MKFSIIIPAHDEEKYLGACLDSISVAEKPPGSEVEVIVVLNRCTDGTETMARDWGAAVVEDDSRCLSRIRNCGAAAASGDVIVTIDADSWMSPNMLCEIAAALESGRYVGGGVRIVMERNSLGIAASLFLVNVAMAVTGLSGGLYWCYRKDFEAVGGFNEDLIVGEDLDFAKRLKRHGKKDGRRLTKLRAAHITTSCRKFDRFGDWFVFRLLLLHPKQLADSATGKDDTFAARYFYDFKR